MRFTSLIAIFTAVVFALSGCGGGGDSGLTQVQAIAKIAQYADSNGNTSEPSINDYTLANINGVNSSNIDQINEYIINLESSDIANMQDIVDHIDYYTADDDNDGIPNGIDDFTQITINAHNHAEPLGIGKRGQLKVLLGDTAKDVYLLLSNYSKTSSDSSTELNHNAKSIDMNNKKTNLPIMKVPVRKILPAPERIRDFYKHTKDSLVANTYTSSQKQFSSSRNISMKTVGDSETFYYDTGTNDHTGATLKKISSNISTNHGNKTLNIWVSDDSSGEGCGKAKCVTQEMVDALANSFLKSGSDNDLYDWVTNIYGEEWGSDAGEKYGNIIAADNEISILITDIDNDNSPNGGVIGFFYPKDNYDRTPANKSNERIMFYIDSVMLANEEGGDDESWSIDDPMPMEMLSTLAHEFQHMIHFYQKTIMLTEGEDTDTWLDEMISETTEDIVATKLQHSGPRNVEYTDGSAGSAGNLNGRYPLFNDKNTRSLTSFSDIADYSQVSAFGTFLIRNYGGPKLLHDTVHNAHTDQDALMYAIHQSTNGVGKTFDDLLREWGIAVLMSDIESPANLPTYNTGDFTDTTYNGITYELGSINFFNYDPEPTVHNTIGTIKPQGNYYYKVGSGLTGDVDINLNLGSNTEATLIVKDSN